MKMLYTPMALMQASHRQTIGAKRNPTLCVPKCCKANKPTRITHVTGSRTSANQHDTAESSTFQRDTTELSQSMQQSDHNQHSRYHIIIKQQ